jgi:hypothetical protein
MVTMLKFLSFFMYCNVIFSNYPSLKPNNIGILSGIGTYEELDNIQNATYSPRASILGIQAQHALKKFNSKISFLLEYQFIQHIGIQHCQEYVLQPLLKFSNLLNTQIPINFSIDDGISYLGGAAPKLEALRGHGIKRGLNVLTLEFSFFPSSKNEIFFRLHHRCYLFGKICRVGIGSNFWQIGYRFWF